MQLVSRRSFKNKKRKMFRTCIHLNRRGFRMAEKNLFLKRATGMNALEIFQGYIFNDRYTSHKGFHVSIHATTCGVTNQKVRKLIFFSFLFK